jgi:hypothetical protein
MRGKKWLARVFGLLYLTSIVLLCAAKPAVATSPACQRCMQSDACFPCCECGGGSPSFCFDQCTVG